MIRKLIIGIFLTLFLVSCNRTYEKGMKSEDPEFMLKAADKLYEKEDWAYAIELYRKVAPSYAGKEQSERIALNSAYANFYDENFPLAAKQFKNYYLTFNKKENAEEALYMSAFSYYKGSPEYNLDQSNTYEALRELQGFIDAYPESDKVDQVNEYINELQKKLERKAFEIAEAYYITLKYKAAAVEFANFLDDFPDSNLREEAFINLLRSRAQLALNSIYALKENRLKDADTTYKIFTKAYPDSIFASEAKDWSDKINQEIQLHNKLMKTVKENSTK